MLTTSSESSDPVAPRNSENNERDESPWLQAHKALSRLAQERAAADAEEGRCLLAALRTAAHAHLGFGSFGEYVERMFGYKPRSTQEKLRVAEALEELPAIRVALETGVLNWSAVRELTRVAVPETEHAWLKVARGKTVNLLEALVAGKPRGAEPSSEAFPGARRHVLRFEVAAETLCLFREAMHKLQRDSGASLDDDSALMLMARHILGGPAEGDEGRAPYPIALSICPQCSRGSQQANGELVAVAEEIVAMAECDGQQLGLLPTAVTAVDHAGADGCAAGAHTGVRAETAGAHTGVRAETAAAHTGAGSKVDRTDRARAKQSIPPATRRAVLRRDHHRCCVPGCRHARYVDLHHIRLSSEGGSNAPSNIITLCSAHHRAVHRGELSITGSVPEGVYFRHADGTLYGQSLDPRTVEVQTKAFAALRKLGFRESETRQVLAELCNEHGVEPPRVERILRDAVARLTSSSSLSKVPRPSGKRPGT
jgi:hypothetical protein